MVLFRGDCGWIATQVRPNFASPMVSPGILLGLGLIEDRLGRFEKAERGSRIAAGGPGWTWGELKGKPPGQPQNRGNLSPFWD